MNARADFTIPPRRHPTPAEIKHEILDAIFDDMEKHTPLGTVPYIPSRVVRIVKDAISRACNRSNAE